MDLSGRTIGIIAGQGFGDSQIVEAAQILRQRGAKVLVIGIGEVEAVAIAGRQGSLLKPDVVVGKVSAGDLDAVYIPGGDAVARLSSDERVLTLLLEMNSLNKPISASCSGAAVVAASGLISGKRVTGTPGIKDTLEKAGAIYLSQGVVVDHNIVTAQSEDDIPHFIDAVSFFLEPATTLS
ncbi:MAG: DJ-1/PfpI family protein [Thermoleophilia bacterium]